VFLCSRGQDCSRVVHLGNDLKDGWCDDLEEVGRFGVLSMNGLKNNPTSFA
jgi:hypothetical protein